MDKSISDVLFFHNNSSRNVHNSSLRPFVNDVEEYDFKSGNLA
jgi:hypothetical protein